MLVFASLSIRTTPFPPVLALFSSFQEKFTHDLRPGTLHHFQFFFAQNLVNFVLRKLTKLLTTNRVHDKLSSLVNVQVNLLSSVQGQIVRVNTLLTLLAKTLLEVGADSVGWILVL